MTRNGGSTMVAWGADAKYTRLIEQHGNALLHLALLLTGNRHDAEDIVQDAIISVAGAWRTAQPKSEVAYLKRSVANKAIDIARRRRDIPAAEIPDVAIEDFGFLRYEEDQRFFALVATLPERQRATLILRFHADLDDRAIAKILGVSITTVRSQAQHGLTKLRTMHATLREGN